MPSGEKIQIEHASGVKDIDIAASGTNSSTFGMGPRCILSLNWAAPGVNSYFTADSRQEPGDSWAEVKKADGTQWTFPSDATDLTAAGSVGADAFKEFIGLGEIRLVANDAQTGGWTLKIRVSG